MSPEWTSCPSCRLRHGRRPDGCCPRCKQSLEHASAAPGMPDVYDGRPVTGPRHEQAASRGSHSQRALIASILISLLAAQAGRYLYGHFLGPELWGRVLASGSSVNERLRRVADTFNAGLPRDVDADTRLMRVSVRDREIVYEMVLIRYSSRELDAGRFLAEAGATVRTLACSSDQMKTFWKDGITASYQYAGNDQIAIGTVSVSPSDCGA